MNKTQPQRSKLVPVLLTIAATLFVVFILLPWSFGAIRNSTFGNVALIPISGMITSDGGSVLGRSTLSSQDIVEFIEQANEHPRVKVIVLEINSPGGSAVASDEIAQAVHRSQKPVIAQIREVGASGGYWIASATDHIIANRMSITGSIGVLSSYLEFSGLMEKYGVEYERLVAGEYKDTGSPFKKLDEKERKLLETKINKIHTFFIEEIAQNRHLEKKEVQRLATGEFFLGAEALNLGLVDQLGDKSTVEEYIRNTYGLEEIQYISYQREISFIELLSGVFSNFSFHIGEGMGAILIQRDSLPMMLV